MGLGKSFKITKRLDKNHYIALSDFEKIFAEEKKSKESEAEGADKNKEKEDKIKMETQIARMEEAFLDENGNMTKKEYRVYFEFPEGQKGSISWIPNLIETYAKERQGLPKEYQYNFIGSMYYDDENKAFRYSMASTNEKAKKLIDSLNKKLRRLSVKQGIDLGKPTFIEKLANKMNMIKNSPEDGEKVKVSKREYLKLKKYIEEVPKLGRNLDTEKEKETNEINEEKDGEEER